MKNECVFSEDRQYRYVLKHSWVRHDLFVKENEKTIAWIGLNPSTADENQLDPTLRRIKSFSTSFGFNSFVMLNLFAYRATKPSDMKSQSDPIGLDNDHWLLKKSEECGVVVFACGGHGSFLNRAEYVFDLIKNKSKVHYLDKTASGIPRHPLYLKSDLNLIELTEIS